MSELEDIAKLVPIDQVASRLGVDPSTAQAAVAQALPAFVGGLHANAQNPGGASSLLTALLGKDTSLATGMASLGDIDTQDGAKIVQHVFGDNKDQVIAALGSTGSAGSGIVSKLLPILAPIVMAYIADKVTGGKTAPTPTAPVPAPAQQPSAGGLTDVLGSILGGGPSSGGGGLGGLGSILGSLLGGGTK